MVDERMSKPSGLDEEYDRRTEELSRSYHFYDQCAVTNKYYVVVLCSNAVMIACLEVIHCM